MRVPFPAGGRRAQVEGLDGGTGDAIPAATKVYLVHLQYRKLAAETLQGWAPEDAILFERRKKSPLSGGLHCGP